MADKPLEPGTYFAGYRIVDLLGSGRASHTYRARTSGNAPVVLRVLTVQDPQRFLHEQGRIATYSHPWVAPVLEAGLVGDAVYVVRPFIRGPSLAAILLLDDVEPKKLAMFMLEAASALEEAHLAEIVHGNLAPENVFVEDVSFTRPVIVDFGTFAPTQSDRPGRAQYLSPEVANGEAPTKASDVYSFAALADAAFPSYPHDLPERRRALSDDPKDRPADYGLVGVAHELVDVVGYERLGPPWTGIGPDSSEEMPHFTGGIGPDDDLPEEMPSVERTLTPVVNTGFEAEDAIGFRLSRHESLRPGARYFFSLDVGLADPWSIEETPVPLPSDELPRGAELAVTLHPVDGGVHVPYDARLGVLRLMDDGRTAVLSHPTAVPDGAHPDRLMFPVDMLAGRGEIRLRSSIHHGTTLVQSRLVTARVVEPGSGKRGRISSELDYALATSLVPQAVEPLNDVDVSFMLNGDEDTHAIQVLARDGRSGTLHTRGAWYDATTLQVIVRHARRVLRKAAYGSEGAWKEGDAYRYEGPPDAERLRVDLARLAITGWRLYDACVNRLAGGGGEAADAFADSMRSPRKIQLASRRDARLLLPIALFYDSPLDTSVPLENLRLCDVYASPSVERSPCLRGDCPHHGEDDVICPGGFWGFRHVIGLPLSIANAPGESAATEIAYEGGPALTMAVSTDRAFTLRASHEEEVKTLVDVTRWSYAASLDATIKLLQEASSQLFYFYCHGGVANDTPYLQVGGPSERGMTSDMVRAKMIRWKAPRRPLVFINGCHTTGLEPEQVFNFVSALVENAAAAGVVGTEITNFEPLASRFATECLTRFLAGHPIGEAVRAARLALLHEGNPLGLIYVPFAMPSLSLVAS